MSEPQEPFIPEGGVLAAKSTFEKAAEALFYASGRVRDVPWEKANKVLALWPPGDVQDHFRKQVVAVLEAIREPDDAMVDAAQSWNNASDYDLNRSRWDWISMIDSLLSQGKNGHG